MKRAILYSVILAAMTAGFSQAQTRSAKLLPVPDGFLRIAPRSYSEAEIHRLLGDGPRIRVNSAQSNRLNLELRYGANWNLNVGPPGMRATSEGGLVGLQVETLLLKDGTSVLVKKPYGRAQYYLGEGDGFRETREFLLNGSIFSAGRHPDP